MADFGQIVKSFTNPVLGEIYYFMGKFDKFIKYYKITHYNLIILAIITFIIITPKTSDPFLNGLCVTLGSSIPILFVLYIFHYLPIKRQNYNFLKMIPNDIVKIQKQIDFDKEKMTTLFGSTDIMVAYLNLKENWGFIEPAAKVLFEYWQRISQNELKILQKELELTYRSIYNFDKYIFEIFHKKYFGINEQEKYIPPIK